MNAAHLHLLVNHLPILGTFLAIPLIGLVFWRPRDRGLLVGAALILALSGLGAGAALSSGEGAEETVEHLPGVSERLIHAHEEAAEVAAGFAGFAALAGLGVLGWGLVREGGAHRLATAGVLVATLASAGAMAYTGSTGGVIRHEEIRGDQASALTLGASLLGGAAFASEGDEEEDDDEDEARERGERRRTQLRRRDRVHTPPAAEEPPRDADDAPGYEEQVTPPADDAEDDDAEREEREDDDDDD